MGTGEKRISVEQTGANRWKVTGESFSYSSGGKNRHIARHKEGDGRKGEENVDVHI